MVIKLVKKIHLIYKYNFLFILFFEIFRISIKLTNFAEILLIHSIYEYSFITIKTIDKFIRDIQLRKIYKDRKKIAGIIHRNQEISKIITKGTSIVKTINYIKY